MGDVKKRLFFALWPDASERTAISAGASRAIAGAGSRAVPAVNYHITLAFLGPVSASSVAGIVEVVSSVRFLPFRLELDHTGYWPKSRVAWLAPSTCPLQLSDLVDNLWNKLAALGFEAEARAYRPHVTLARRVSGGFGKRLPKTIIWQANSFALAESCPGSSGPVYRLLEQFPAGA